MKANNWNQWIVSVRKPEQDGSQIEESDGQLYFSDKLKEMTTLKRGNQYPNLENFSIHQKTRFCRTVRQSNVGKHYPKSIGPFHFLFSLLLTKIPPFHFITCFQIFAYEMVKTYIVFIVSYTNHLKIENKGKTR